MTFISTTLLVKICSALEHNLFQVASMEDVEVIQEKDTA